MHGLQNKARVRKSGTTHVSGLAKILFFYRANNLLFTLIVLKKNIAIDVLRALLSFPWSMVVEKSDLGYSTLEKSI